MENFNNKIINGKNIDKEIVAENLLERIKKEFPDLEWSESRLKSSGWQYDVIILDNKYIFRFPKNKRDEESLKDEANLLSNIGPKLSVPIPQYEYIADDGSFAGYKIIEGQQLKPQVYKNELSRQNKENVARQLSQFLSELHAMSSEELDEFNVKTINEIEDMKSLEQKAEMNIFPKLKKEEQEAIKDYFKEFAKQAENMPAQALTHGDLTFDHIFIDPESKDLSGIIDFGDSTFSDPAKDFAGLWIYGEDFVNGVYKHYAGRKDESFLKRSNLYFKKKSLEMMQGALNNKPIKFSRAHNKFKERFNL